MKLIVFSDVHGNSEALRLMLYNTESYTDAMYLFLGDVVGYLYWQDETFRLLENIKNLIAIRGNHDQMYLDCVFNDVKRNCLYEKYGCSFLREYSRSDIQFLESMQEYAFFKINGLRIGAFHGTPEDIYNGRYYPDNTDVLTGTDKYDVLFLANTHYRIDRKQGGTRILNPGSLGLPRDGNGFSYLVFDTVDCSYSFETINLDASVFLSKIRKVNDCESNKEYVLSRIGEYVVKKVSKNDKIENKPKHILISGIGGNVSCAIARCIRDVTMDRYHLTGFDIDEYAHGKVLMDSFFVSPPYGDIDNYKDFVRNICIEENIDLYIPVNEDEIKIASEMRSFFEDNDIFILINQETILTTCFSKKETSDFLLRNRIKAPVTHLADQYIPKEYPVIVKNDRGNGSHGLLFIQSEEEFKSYKGKFKGMVVQPYVGNAYDEYTMPVWSNGKEIRSFAMKRKLGMDGMTVCTKFDPNNNFTVLAEKIANVFNLHGDIDVQFRVVNEEPIVFEINPRFSSSVGFRSLCGFTDVVWSIEEAFGETLTPWLKSRSIIYGRKALSEMIFNEGGKCIGRFRL